jgi:hypothetical protein
VVSAPLHGAHAAGGHARGAHAGPPQRRVHLRDHAGKGVLHVGDAELEERRPLHDLLGAGRVAEAGKLHHDPVGPHALHQRLGHAELVDPGADHGQGALQRVGGIRHLPAALVNLQRQVNAALQVQALLDGHPLHGGVAHAAVGTPRTNGDLLRPQTQSHHVERGRPHTHEDEPGDDE